MNLEEARDRLLLEIRKNSILPTENYTPTPDHYMPLRFLEYYLDLAYSLGFDEGRNDRHARNQKRILQCFDGKIIKPFDSIATAARSVKGDRRNLSKRVGTNIPYKGFTWEYEK